MFSKNHLNETFAIIYSDFHSELTISASFVYINQKIQAQFYVV